ncbi:penicillin-binding protein activator LpoB [Ectothiorhodospiraceae bacterium 2226]|nr:penicillin-binding protein activator LpoB [Ectothiorhodospiraceae bacterium 2226]
MKRRLLFVGVLALGAVVLTSGCATRVDRLETSEVRDLSGAWNDTDSRLVSEEMIQDVLVHPWVGNYVRSHNRQPAVTVGTVRNLSHEHINVGTFVNDMQRALINSGRVDFVAARGEREDLREERREQELHAREDTRKAMGQELGADFMLGGSINTIFDREGKREVRYYQVDLTLTSLADNRIVWQGQKKIKKYVSRASLRP